MYDIFNFIDRDCFHKTYLRFVRNILYPVKVSELLRTYSNNFSLIYQKNYKNINANLTGIHFVIIMFDTFFSDICVYIKFFITTLILYYLHGYIVIIFSRRENVKKTFLFHAKTIVRDQL